MRWLELGVYIPSSPGRGGGRRAVTGKQMTFMKDKWALRRRDGRYDISRTMCALAWGF